MDRTRFVKETVRLLLEQRSYANRGTFCSYRTADGRKCAIGVHIPDDKYDPHWEGKSIDFGGCIGILDILKEKYGFIEENDIAFLGAVQFRLHDKRVNQYPVPTPLATEIEALALLKEWL